MAEWRWLQSGLAPGPWNMALDEAILRLHVEHRVSATLRIYGWSPPCLTVGYSQSVARDIDLARCQAEGIPVVRRPTGGRAILHQAETTFSLVSSTPQGSITQSYDQVARAVILALATLGLDAEMAGPRGRPSDSQRSGACFDSAYGHEILLGGRKIAGIAQARRQDSVLCQGTLLLDTDAPRLFDLLRMPSQGVREQSVRQFESKVVSLSEALGHPVSWEQAAAALAQGFAQALGSELAPAEPTVGETTLAQQLVREKYASPAWNLGR